MKNLETNSTQKIHIFHAAMSMLVPGLGQLLQGRIEAFLGCSALFCLTAFVPAITMLESFSFIPSFLLKDLFPYLPLLLFPFVVILFAVLDAASWRKDTKTSLNKSFAWWARTTAKSNFLTTKYAKGGTKVTKEYHKKNI